MKKKNYENYKNLNKTMNIKMLIAFILGAIISITSSYAIAETLINSKDVSYVDNSKLGATNVQAAIDGTCTKFSNDLQSFLLKVYPVGSIYISYDSTNPGTLFGGTWEAFGKGQTLVGIDTNSTEFKTLGQAGGSKTISYTPSGSIGSTGLTINQIPSHTHSISHTHTTPQTTTTTMSLTAQSAGNHNHVLAFGAISGNSRGFSTWGDTYGYDSTGATATGYGGAHTHSVTGSVTVPVMTTNSISTSTSGAAGKGTTSDGHTHSFTGSAATLNNLQPYITVYMWKRTN